MMTCTPEPIWCKQWFKNCRNSSSGTHWGKLITYTVQVNFYFAVGFCYTLSRDVVQQFVSYTPLVRLVYTPYSKGKEVKFFLFFLHHEDMMVGYVLHKVMGNNITFVSEPPSRFHDLYRGYHSRNVTWSSVVVHHTKEKDYKMLMNIFGNDTAPPAKAYKV
ncbi:putative UDP-Gal or UDP-GlcNAc-dependent glycosyltransferase, partial [Trypanosoma theileri]